MANRGLGGDEDLAKVVRFAQGFERGGGLLEGDGLCDEAFDREPAGGEHAGDEVEIGRHVGEREAHPQSLEGRPRGP